MSTTLRTLKLTSPITAFLWLLAFSACTVFLPSRPAINVTVEDNGQRHQITVPVGTTVQTVIDRLNLPLGVLDRTEPPTFTVLNRDSRITIIRVKEVFETEEVVVPFEQQVVRNESLSEGETRLVQPGENGLQQITYRRLLENGKEVARTIFKVETIREPRPEIVMVGVQSPLTPLDLPGSLVYLAGGNAWLIRENSANRYPIVTTGDLDGRVFTLSPDGKWLLYTRQSNTSNEINTLWVVNLTIEHPQPINLKVSNVVHYAEWVPGVSLTIAYSTVEPRNAPPGWQANNDFYRLSFSPEGRILKNEKLIDANAGGIYGWWGTTFAWAPDGNALAYARPDSVGLVNLKEQTFEPRFSLQPLETGGNWAWVPGIAWSADGRFLYTSTNSESDPQVFSLSALSLTYDLMVDVVKNTGMFANPTPIPDNQHFPQWVAYLQALFPTQSESSRYRLALIDRDGSDQRILFPPEGSIGLEPQRPVWSPPSSPQWIGIIYQGNLWLVEVPSGQARQITGDGLIRRIDWK